MIGPVLPVAGPGTRELVNGWLRKYHYLGQLPGWKHAAALRAVGNDLLWEGVVVLGSPASRVLMERGYTEIRRLAVKGGAPKNSASRLLGYATRWAAANGYLRVVSYADPSVGRAGCPGDQHKGRIYLAANFRPDGETKDHSRDVGWGSRPTRKTRYLGSKLRFVWEVPA